MEKMTIEIYRYKGFELHKRVDVKTSTVLIHKGTKLIKGIAGNIFADGSENSIEKAKAWVDAYLRH